MTGPTARVALGLRTLLPAGAAHAVDGVIEVNRPASTPGAEPGRDAAIR